MRTSSASAVETRSSSENIIDILGTSVVVWAMLPCTRSYRPVDMAMALYMHGLWQVNIGILLISVNIGALNWVGDISVST